MMLLVHRRKALPLALAILTAGISFAAAPVRVLVRTVDGDTFEADALNMRPLMGVKVDRILSAHSGVEASEYEKKRIEEGLAIINGAPAKTDADRKTRDLAIEELTAIGIPVMTPLLKLYKDTDQHEPRPLYRLFERVMPSIADGFDRNQSMVRTPDGPIRGNLPTEGSLELKMLDGRPNTVAWEKVRMIAVRQRAVFRSARVHSIEHSIQIEYLDTGIVLSPTSKIDALGKGFVRLSWDTDSWASDADGLTKPGSPAYKSHLVNGHPFGALIGRAGAAGEPFFLGKKAMKTGAGTGRLGLAVNDNAHWQNNLGAFVVNLAVTDAYDLGEAQ